ncbi:protoporphyrinogen oxidase [Opitutus terrae]|uniref:Coproporphyrinogen III oxidase n=1 Tax=Opitutus terrae (strain DSM 11246 / JCM 15787 / PB90-1) TaxID=452637 RepID=B1ZV05_OPITP|nr:protoporphyrinogen oxidase [Opitutus terrae]ACB75975.1 protoporphyrinogen oxidase [Opitutus terrae PB90-1]
MSTSPFNPSATASGRPPKTFAVLGAGITGLTAAHRLTQLGHKVRVFEQSDRVGGSIKTEEVDGWLIEGGPNTLLSGELAVDKLIDELGLNGERIAADPAAKNRYIVRRGRALAAPMSPPSFFASSLFSPVAKFKLLAELFARRRVRTTDVSLAEFVESHFGREFVDYALNPFVGGVYAGDPEKLSARQSFPKLWEIEQTHGSLIRGQIAAAKARKARGEPRPGIFSFKHGLHVLPEALAARLPAGAITLGASLDAIVPGDKWNVVWHDDVATHTQSFDSVVVALPAPALARLQIGTLGEKPLAALALIEHPPVSSLFLGFRREQVAHPLDGFGVLVPAVEKRSVLGVLFSSSLFPGRAPLGHVALTVMVGGTRQPQLASLPADQLLAAVRPDLTQLLGVSGDPVFVRHNFWPRAIPQYNLGHEHFIAALAAGERFHPGLFMGGQARDGIAVPACIAAGEKLAERAGQ